MGLGDPSAPRSSRHRGDLVGSSVRPGRVPVSLRHGSAGRRARTPASVRKARGKGGRRRRKRRCRRPDRVVSPASRRRRDVQRAAARLTPTRVAADVRPTRLCRLAHRSPLPCASARRVATVTETRNSHYRWRLLVARLTRKSQDYGVAGVSGGGLRPVGRGLGWQSWRRTPRTRRATYLLLVRHGTTPTTGKVLPGRAPGLSLSDAGRAEAGEVGRRLGESRQRAGPLLLADGAGGRDGRADRAFVPAFPSRSSPSSSSAMPGRGPGRGCAPCATGGTWQAVLRHPSGFRFPGGESFIELQARVLVDDRATDVAPSWRGRCRGQPCGSDQGRARQRARQPARPVAADRRRDVLDEHRRLRRGPAARARAEHLRHPGTRRRAGAGGTHGTARAGTRSRRPRTIAAARRSAARPRSGMRAT